MDRRAWVVALVVVCACGESEPSESEQPEVEQRAEAHMQDTELDYDDCGTVEILECREGPRPDTTDEPPPGLVGEEECLLDAFEACRPAALTVLTDATQQRLLVDLSEDSGCSISLFQDDPREFDGVQQFTCANVIDQLFEEGQFCTQVVPATCELVRSW